MSFELNMKEIERKAYMSYNEDGLVDIVIGFVFLGWGVLLVVEPSGLIALLGPIAFTLWYLGKRYLTVPRIGIIKPSQKMENKLKNLAVFLLVLGVITMVGVLLVWMGRSSLTANHSLGMLGLVIAAGICGVAFLLNANRLYVYALLLLLAFAGGEALNGIVASFDTFIISVILVSAIILLSGSVVLVRFLRKYRLPKREA